MSYISAALIGVCVAFALFLMAALAIPWLFAFFEHYCDFVKAVTR